MVYEEIEAAKFRVKFREYFHMKNLYVMMREWLIENDWASRVDPEFGEIFYLQREFQKPGDELWIWWRMQKPTASAYYLWKMDIDFHVLFLREAEIMHKGQKFKTYWGEVEVMIRAVIITDPDKKWERHWLLRHINDFVRGRILKEQIEKNRIECYREAYRFQEAIKSFLNLRTFLPEPEDQAGVLWPKGGIGE